MADPCAPFGIITVLLMYITLHTSKATAQELEFIALVWVVHNPCHKVLISWSEENL